VSLARKSIDAHLRGEPDALVDGELPEEIKNPSLGAFVSLYQGNSLRGCIGHCFPRRPLYETVAEMAVSAATRDARFAPVTAEELPRIRIEVSVLSRLRELGHPLEVEVGAHGLYVVQGQRHGVLLPQVAVEHGWGKREFLEQVCMKAGLMASGWEMIGTRVFVFTVQLMAEERGSAKD
jgi:AmmeMemoRadiSam system protein A